MKLKAVTLKNFRPYRTDTRIELSDLTALIGKNDVGKSCILEALEIFFNNTTVKLDEHDLCVMAGDDKEIEIGCVFTDLPPTVVLDEAAHTSLGKEHLLNAGGDLEIIKRYDCAAKTLKECVFARALHPTAENVSDLLLLKNAELKKRLDELGVSRDAVDLRVNPSIRTVLWSAVAELKLELQLIPLDKEDGKRIWESLKKELPIYALFQADRASKDEDSEVQDPMKVAIKEALAGVEDELQRIKDAVRDKATEVATRTVEKLREMAPALAGQLSPHFKAEPKWDGLFKLTLTGEGEIPLNKRGSGVRRLILLNFFRAEAERKQSESKSPGIIYAIEEPEASQHPHNQRMIIEALADLAAQENCQVLITTHVPGLASLLPVYCLRYVSNKDGVMSVTAGTDEVFKNIANELGVLPDNRVRVLVCVEGPNDIACLRHMSRVLHESDATIPDVSATPEIALLPLGGSTLQQWVDNRYLRHLNRPEVHLYDRDEAIPPKHQGEVDTVNGRGDGSFAALTGKRELENYLHPGAIADALCVTVNFGDTDDVPLIVARAVHEAAPDSKPWADVDEETRDDKMRRVKRRLNEEAAARMTVARLNERDVNRDIEGWLREVGQRLN